MAQNQPYGAKDSQFYDTKGNGSNIGRNIQFDGVRFFFSHYNFPKQDKPSETDYDKSDSIWATIGCFCKNYRVPFDEAIYRMAYVNIIMYSKVLPTYHSDRKDKKNGKDDVVTTNNPTDWNETLKKLKRNG